MKMTRYRLAFIVVLAAVVVALLIIGVYILRGSERPRSYTLDMSHTNDCILSYEVIK